jgi:Thioredoxin
MFKATALFGGAIVLIAACWIGSRRAGHPARPAISAANPIVPPTAAVGRERIPVAGAPTRGDEHGKVVVVEFSDFQCPACGHAEPTVQAMQQQLGDDVELVWKNLPLEEMHPFARLAAEAALAAGAQGQFWPMHDKLFAHQRSLDRASLERFARELHLDVARFKQALDSRAYRASVDADVALAEKLGVSGTPTFFVDGERIDDWTTELIPSTQRELARAGLGGAVEVAPPPHSGDTPAVPICPHPVHNEPAQGSCT